MRERGILMSAPMVRSLLAGTKTQTRRVVSEPYHVNLAEGILRRFTRGGENWVESIGPVEAPKSSPYGQPGDRLWVRESWRTDWVYDGIKPSKIPATAGARYEADGHETIYGSYSWSKKVRPSLFMPRWASRLTLEVTGVRVERLQGISGTDAIAEGVTMPEIMPQSLNLQWDVAKGLYRALWESINGPGSWDANPWVWVVEFKRVSP